VLGTALKRVSKPVSGRFNCDQRLQLKVHRLCSWRIGNSAIDPNVWSGRALQENLVDLQAAVLHQCIRPLIGARFGLRAIMDISARAVFLADRSLWTIRVTSVRMRREDRSSISSHPLADLGRKPIVGLRHLRPPLSVQFLCSCHEAVPSSRRAVDRGIARRAVKAGRSSRPPAGLGLDGPEHGATLKQVRTPSHASSCIRIRAPCGERPRRSVPAYWRVRSPARCRAISFWRRRSTP
jgi:hypothetical protein